MNRKIRVAIIGVGNCASSLIQGVEFYKAATDGDFVPGLMHVELGGYHPRDTPHRLVLGDRGPVKTREWEPAKRRDEGVRRYLGWVDLDLN